MIVCSFFKGGGCGIGEEGRGYLDTWHLTVPSLSWDLVFGHKHEDLMLARRENPRTGLTLWCLGKVLAQYCLSPFNQISTACHSLPEISSIASTPECPKC